MQYPKSDDLVVVRTIFDLEQTDPVRIKRERDMLAQAIVEMGIGIKLTSPEAVLTGPHLLQICQDVVESQPKVSAIIDTCNLGHQYAKLSDHPVDTLGNFRCPHCLAAGLDGARARIKILTGT
jgi:hypothetical protein